jgi:hypothetical protein
MVDPPPVHSTSDEILKSLIRQEHWMASIDKRLSQINQSAVVMICFGIFLFVTEIVLRTR